MYVMKIVDFSFQKGQHCFNLIAFRRYKKDSIDYSASNFIKQLNNSRKDNNPSISPPSGSIVHTEEGKEEGFRFSKLNDNSSFGMGEGESRQ